MARLFVAGFHHETNTFAPSFADWAAFECGAGYPAYVRGAAMLDQMQGGSLPIGGFAQAAREQRWTLVPSVWAGAMPSNRVTAEAFERICGEIVMDLRAALHDGLDAVYLDLHGAAVAEGADDAEGELLQRLRAVVGLDLFRFLGVEPARMKLLVVKSSVHFRAAFAPIASHILVAKAPGPMAADPGDLPWSRLAPGMAPRP